MSESVGRYVVAEEATVLIGLPGDPRLSATWSDTAKHWTLTYWHATPPIVRTAETFRAAVDQIAAALQDDANWLRGYYRC